MTRNADTQHRGTDALIRDTTPEPAQQRLTAYVRPDQVDVLDQLRAAHRKAGRRTVTASVLVRTALDLAKQHPDEWDEYVAGAVGGDA